MAGGAAGQDHARNPLCRACPFPESALHTVYGTADSTILYLIVLSETYRWTGDVELLKEYRAGAEQCLHWIDAYGDLDGDGFQAINHAATPVLHPASQDVLHSGMVHNMEPAVYLDGKDGFRLNDNVAVRAEGNEALSSALPHELDWLILED